MSIYVSGKTLYARKNKVWDVNFFSVLFVASKKGKKNKFWSIFIRVGDRYKRLIHLDFNILEWYTFYFFIYTM